MKRLHSTSKQSISNKEETAKKPAIIEKYNITNGKELTTMYLGIDVLFLTDLFQN